MCTDRDCGIFRGKLMACDGCEHLNEKGISGHGTAGLGAIGCHKGPQRP